MSKTNLFKAMGTKSIADVDNVAKAFGETQKPRKHKVNALVSTTELGELKSFTLETGLKSQQELIHQFIQEGLARLNFEKKKR